MAQYALRAEDEVMGKWKDGARLRGMSFAVFCRHALDAYCDDGAIGDRVVGKAEPLIVAELPDRGVKARVAEPASSDLFEPLALMEEAIAWPDPPEVVVFDNTVARIFDRLESGEASPSRPRKSRSQPCEHRVPPTAFCHWCD